MEKYRRRWSRNVLGSSLTFCTLRRASLADVTIVAAYVTNYHAYADACVNAAAVTETFAATRE